MTRLTVRFGRFSDWSNPPPAPTDAPSGARDPRAPDPPVAPGRLATGLGRDGSPTLPVPLKTDLFDYPLPEAHIAQQPAERRDHSRLLVVHRQEHRLEHRAFHELSTFLRAGDLLIRNTAAVIPARLHAHRPSGGAVECLLLHPATLVPADGVAPAATEDWWCLLRPGRKLPVGASFGIAGAFTATVREKHEDGTARVAFACAGRELLAVARELGEMPLPPYIAPRQDEALRALDRSRYQTVYADRQRTVAAAAPTAGLHFTPEALAQLAAQGVRTADVTLHVGLGTFRPIATEEIEAHPIHREAYELPAATRRLLRQPGGRRIAVGTTSLRTIEDYLARPTPPETADAPFAANAGIFIYPPAVFRGADALLTNFHQPRSTLLCLVAAFLAPGSTEGVAWIREIYAEALARDYRFLSYGDAMLIL